MTFFVKNQLYTSKKYINFVENYNFIQAKSYIDFIDTYTV